jgi:CelD/BcsL family acetyltransferase involved in cellulose biosynthesis
MVQSIRRLESLREPWEAMAQRFQSPLVGHDWFLSCAEAFHRDSDISVLTTSAGGEVSGIAPLVREGPRVVVLGAGQLYEPCDFVYATDAAATELVEKAVALGRPLILQRVSDDSAVVRAVQGLPLTRAWRVVRESASALGVNTQGAWATYHASLSSRLRTNLPRLQRKAQKALGPMSIRHHHPTPSDVDAHLETFARVEGSGWKGRHGSSLSARPDLRRFFERYCRRVAAKGQLCMATLSFGADVAAVELSVEAYGRMWQLKIGYLDSLAAYYPGLHLTEASIRSAFERGLRSYEFLGSAARWEERWRPDARSYRLLAVYPTTPRGLAGACGDVVRAGRRRFARRPTAPRDVDGLPEDQKAASCTS